MINTNTCVFTSTQILKMEYIYTHLLQPDDRYILWVILKYSK